MKNILMNSGKEEGTSTVNKCKWSQPVEVTLVNSGKKEDAEPDCNNSASSDDSFAEAAVEKKNLKHVLNATVVENESLLGEKFSTLCLARKSTVGLGDCQILGMFGLIWN